MKPFTIYNEGRINYLATGKLHAEYHLGRKFAEFNDWFERVTDLNPSSR